MTQSRRLAGVAMAFFWVLPLTGCAATMNVSSFVERGVDFARYRTYDWAPDDRLSTGDPRLDNNRFFLARLQADVEKQLARRGFDKVTSGGSELILHYHANVTQKVDVSATDHQYGSCDRCSASVYDAGTLLLDFVDARTNTLVWRGWAEGSLDGVIDHQDWMEEKVDDAVARILARLPTRL